LTKLSMNTVTSNPDKVEVEHLLIECGLPVSDITSDHMEHFFAAGDPSGLTGVVGLEPYGDVALLRSLAVSPKHRGTRLAKQLVAHAEQYALAHRVQAIYLLTTTADKFFSGLGYSSVSRSQAPSAIQSTTEFSSLCPSSSVFMVKRLVIDEPR
jgi:amino-acid N-acetyltransferase